MAEDFGNGVSRTLSAIARQFQTVVFQQHKPPLDSELNLFSQIEDERFRQLVQSQVPSGWLLDPTRALDDFRTNFLYSNAFEFGQERKASDGSVEEFAPSTIAVVNGWVIPVTGSHSSEENSTTNWIALNPPPTSGSRVDFVFLEVWKALLGAQSNTNKPSNDKVWKYGNVGYGGTNPDDQIIDPDPGFETTKRVQLQYRIRVVGDGSGAGSSPDLVSYPDGLGDPNITAQGPNNLPSTFTFQNMREELGDPSLWRAGDGVPATTNTVDGYIYAIPIAAVFRRNSSPFVAVNLAGDPNQNGAFNRKPSSVDQTDAVLLTQMSLINDLPAVDNNVDLVVPVDFALGSGWDDPGHNLNNVFMVIDDEVIGIKAIDTVSSPNTVTIPAGGRGRWGSDIVFHAGRSNVNVAGSGTPIHFFNTNPAGPFADEISLEDVLDLRRGVCFGDWDYERILRHNLASLMKNDLRSTWKRTGVPGGNTEGVSVIDVDYLFADGNTAVPNGTEAVDGPDGIRQVWSDAAVIQGDVTVLLDNDGTMNAGFIQTFDDLVEWDVGADFKPAGFMNNLNNATPGFTNGSTVFIYLGGDDGNQGARKTFRAAGTRAVRFVSPKEYYLKTKSESSTGMQHPITALWVNSDQANQGLNVGGAGLQALSPAGPGENSTEHPGPLYPLRSLNFEKPFLVLGGILNDVLFVTGINGATQLIGNSADPSIPLGEGEIVFPGFNFDTQGDWWGLDQNQKFSLDPSNIQFPVLRGQRTLFDMLTMGGKDRTGSSSEVYLILYGDDETTENNGAFQVIGAGTIGYTTKSASAPDRLRVRFVTQGVTDFNNTTTKTVTAEVRSQITNAEDGLGAALGPASLTITFTDLEGQSGGTSNPWNPAVINPLNQAGRSLTPPFNYKCLLNFTLLYHPNRGALQRVPDFIEKVALQAPNSKILRQSRAVLDTVFPSETGAPGNPIEVDYDPTHIQTWNRLPSLGLSGPVAPDYGGDVVLFSEVDRENESFFDNGSKSLVFRPYQRQNMTIRGITTNNTHIDNPTLLGPSGYPNPALIPNAWNGPKDDAQIFTVGLQMGYAVPQQYLPRFGRQDIPYYQDNGPAYGAGTFLEGINHLFADTTDLTNPVFDVIGGEDNQSGGQLVTRFLVQTGPTSGLPYSQFGNVTGTLSDAYQGRLTTDIGTATNHARTLTERLANIASSDFGTGLRGIQLPPYLGIARLYGVYDRRDFVAKGGSTYMADRVTPELDRATNLLRRDATRQTLFLFENGALDLTGVDGDHTYIIPENVLDITKSPHYVNGEDFADLEYVVEFTCFGFARGWITQNNYVMARRHNGQGTLRTDGDNPELESIRMCIPSAAPDGSRIYISSVRTVYQGDPFFTRSGETPTVSDYETRYGEFSQANAFELSKRIQQFDSNGNPIPETPNARSFEILAAMDVYTTMGTGNIGGKLFPGTPTDVGFTENNPLSSTRIPPRIDYPAWRILTRAFTEGQSKNVSRATASLDILGNNATFIFGVSAVTITALNGQQVSFVAVNGPTANEAEFDASSPDQAVIARELWQKINDRGALQGTLKAYNAKDSTVIQLVSKVVGDEGNNIEIEINDVDNFMLQVFKTGAQGLDTVFTSTNFTGGLDEVVNAGDGTTQLELSGMTERFPLGILLKDSDFIGENPLADNASAVNTLAGGIRPIQSLLPLTKSAGEEFTRFLGSPGTEIALSDGSVLQYGAYNETTNPGGTKRFRLFRGGGAAYMADGENPGGPLDWVTTTLEPALKPILKGGLLTVKALLVRNFPETAFASNQATSEGDEIQMVLLTYGILGNGNTTTEGLDLEGIISPTGYGEGYAAADRYRLMGKPMFRGRTRVSSKDPKEFPLAFYPGRNAF